MHLNGWATKLLSMVLIQHWYPCCVLSGPVVPLISFFPSPLPQVERVFSCILPASALRNCSGQTILLSVGPEVLCPWNFVLRRPNSGVRKSLSIVLYYGSPEQVNSSETWAPCDTTWARRASSNEWKIQTVLIVYQSLIQNGNVTVLGNVAVLFHISIMKDFCANSIVNLVPFCLYCSLLPYLLQCSWS